MPTRFERWMRSKLSASTARTPSKRGPLAAQSRDEPEPYSLPASIISGMPSARYFSEASKMVISFAVGQVAGVSAFALGRELVAQAHVGEGAAHHDFVIAAARAVGVEVRRLHAVRDQVLSRRAVVLDGAGGRDVVGGDAVAQIAEHARAADVAHRRRRLRHVLEVGRILHVGRARRPRRRSRPVGHCRSAPALVALEDVAVGVAEQVAGDELLQHVVDFLLRSARCPSGRPACRCCCSRAAPCRGRCRCVRPARRPPPAAATSGSWRAPRS